MVALVCTNCGAVCGHEATIDAARAAARGAGCGYCDGGLRADVPAFFDCGCSMLKVGAGKCDTYGPDGQTRENTPREGG